MLVLSFLDSDVYLNLMSAFSMGNDPVISIFIGVHRLITEW